jgi:hypothetical protein
MHLAQLRRDVLEAREDIVRSVACVMVDRVQLLVDRQTMLQESVRIFSGIIDQFRGRLLFCRRRSLHRRLFRCARHWLGGERLNWLRRWLCGCLRNRLRALVEASRR